MTLKIIIFGIILASGIALLVLRYRHDAKNTRDNECKCRTCKYNNWGECESKILCERGEMWESVNNERE